jgi:hypothetical protein
MRGPIRVHITADHEIVRKGLTKGSRCPLGGHKARLALKILPHLIETETVGGDSGPQAFIICSRECNRR